MHEQTITEADKQALKSAFKRACELAGTLDFIAEHVRVHKSQLSRYGNGLDQLYPPIDIMLQVDALSGTDVCLETIVHIRGRKLAGERRPRNVKLEDFRHHIASVSKEAGEAVAGLARLSMKPCPRVAAEVAREIIEAKDALGRTNDDVLRVVAGG